MKKLKIGILTEIINFHSGSRAPLEIARHIAKLGHDVTVYALDTKLSPSAKESLKKNGVKIKTFKIDSKFIILNSKLPPLSPPDKTLFHQSYDNSQSVQNRYIA